jgi:glycosyltransferase involved in cell wall biosynthesis
MTPLVSVVIPCFNSANYLPDALESVVKARKNFDLEIIVADDGSNEASTVELLKKLENEGSCIVVRKANGGPASARNLGVGATRGKYILFLDSDNKILPDFLSLTIPILEKNNEVAVVYGEVRFFGEYKNRMKFQSGPFDIDKLIANNYIDVCSLVRRTAWDQVGGMDESRLLIGFEDWEFWIHLASRNWQFIYIRDPLFEYRLRDDSLFSNQLNDENYQVVKKYIYKKHSDLVLDRFNKLYHESEFYRLDRQKPFRSFLKYFTLKYFKNSKTS